MNDTYIDNIKKLDKKEKFDEKYIPSIPLDETRGWSNIFTRSEAKNRDFFLALLNSNEDTTDKIDNLEEIEEKVFRASDLGDFLYEPLAAKTKLLFGSNEGSEKELNEEYEPFSIDGLTTYNIVNDLIELLLKEYKDIEVTKDNIDIDKIKKKFILLHELPTISEVIREKEFNDCLSLAIDFKNLASKIGNYLDINNLADLMIDDYKIIDNVRYLKYVDGNAITYLPIKKMDKPAIKEMLRVYVISLMDVASACDDVSYQIKLQFGIKSNVEFHLDKDKAKETLNLIINKYNDYNNLRFFKFDYFKQNKFDEISLSYSNLVKEFNKSSTESKGIFNKYEDLGYDGNNDTLYKKQLTEEKLLLQDLYLMLEEDLNG